MHELLDETENLRARRWDGVVVWTLIERIQDNVDGRLIRNCKHILETLGQCSFGGLLSALFMLQIKAVKDITTRTRLRGKLDEKRCKEVPTILLVEVPEVEIEVSKRP